MSSEPRVAAPRYNIARIFTLRDYLADDVLSEYCGLAVTGDDFEQFVDDVADSIPRIDRTAVWDSLRCVAGTTLFDNVLSAQMWRLAGNVDRLRRGIAVPPWHVQREPEWMPAHVLAWQPDKSRMGKSGGLFRLRVLAGLACPMIISTFWSGGFCRFISRRIGYTSTRHDYPFGHMSEMVNMRIWILVDPEHCRPGAPGFREVGCTGSLRKWNRTIIKMRFRKNWACPHAYTHYCYQCHVGYRECPAATHEETANGNTGGIERPGE